MTSLSRHINRVCAQFIPLFSHNIFLITQAVYFLL